jgi:hypothetical protein
LGDDDYIPGFECNPGKPRGFDNKFGDIVALPDLRQAGDDEEIQCATGWLCSLSTAAIV